MISTQDLADWMLQCSKNDEMANQYRHKLVGLSSKLDRYMFLTQTKSGRLILIATTALVLGGCYYIYNNLF